VPNATADFAHVFREGTVFSIKTGAARPRHASIWHEKEGYSDKISQN
jgi:hypothetical protein